MNADLIRIRESKLFKKLPDRAFERITSHIKVRAFEDGDEVLNFQNNLEFSQWYGYVVSGQVLFVDEDSKPLGLAIKDEFFLGRPFSLNESAVIKLLSVDNSTFVVFVPRDVITLLAKASEQFSEMMEDIYDSIFDRAKFIQADSNAKQRVQEWLKAPDSSQTVASWVIAIEKRREDSLKQKIREKKARQKIYLVWALGILLCAFFSVECLARFLHWDFSFFYFFNPSLKLDAYKPGSQFNIAIGIIGYVLILLTNLHAFNKWAFKKWKWTLNYQFSQELHMFFGVLGLLFILLHSAFHLKGTNVANLAAFSVMIVVGTGLIGQFISNQIPKTIRGETVKLEQLKAEQAKLREKATLLMNDQSMYKTSILMLSKTAPTSAAQSFFLAPLFWVRARRLRATLETLGLTGESAKLASSYVVQEFNLKQKVKFLEISHVFFKRWMMIHLPIGYLVYFLATAHIILVTLFA
ncbi:MAG: hypothetical protein JWQ35_199 [Bacteriovoracaceae bacterium]|nr:hypothetical protein [Bacteriovoracaceae bacterium]